MLALRDIETLRMRMADGVHLAADVYRPVGPERYPVLVMRLPYGRKVASAVVLAHPAWYAAQGYVVLVQDVRGRGDSEGPSEFSRTMSPTARKHSRWRPILQAATAWWQAMASATTA